MYCVHRAIQRALKNSNAFETCSTVVFPFRFSLFVLQKQSMSLLACQRDSYQTNGLSQVLDCSSLPEGRFSVLLDDSVLYPEGGGQPCDLGTIADFEVLSVSKPSHRESGVEIITTSPIEVGQSVECVVDWSRRFDFMQQHTAQHILSAVADILYAADTVRWELGKEIVTVDIMYEGVMDDVQLQQLEDRVNEEVRRNRQVTYLAADKNSLSSIAGLRGVPKGAAMEFDTLRLVSIDGLDVNPCGGTHVRSTSEVQSVKLVSLERDRGATRIGFVAGNRILRWFGTCIKRDISLCSMLSVGTADFEDTVSRMLAQRKDAAKEKKSLLDELALRIGAQLANDVKAKASSSPVICYHRQKADVSFLLSIADAIFAQVPQALVFLASIDESCAVQSAAPGKASKKKPAAVASEPTYRPNSSGVFVLAGAPQHVNEVKASVFESIGGRGGGRPGKLQGQAEKLEKYVEVEAILVAAANNKLNV